MEHCERCVDDGDLLAYLDGVRPPHVEQALRTSAALRRKLRALRWAEERLRWCFAGIAGELTGDAPSALPPAANHGVR